MKNNAEERPMLDSAESFTGKVEEVINDNMHEDVIDLKDDFNMAMHRMREAIENAYNTDERIMILPCLAEARSRIAALSFYIDLFAETGAINKGDSIEFQSIIEELNIEMARIMKVVDPKLDKWREDYIEEFGERPEDIDKID